MKVPKSTKAKGYAKRAPKGDAKRAIARDSKTGQMLAPKKREGLPAINLDHLKREQKKLRRKGALVGPILAFAPNGGRANPLTALGNIAGSVEKLDRDLADIRDAVAALREALIAGQTAEDIADATTVAHVRSQLASGAEEAIPAEVVKRLDAGEAPVRVFREWRGMTQGQLAAAIDVDQSFISKIEAGTKHPTAANLGRLARALKVDADLLLPDED